MTLSGEDVKRLLQEPTAEHKADIIRKIGENFSADLSDEQRAIAEDIFRAMVKDVEVRVREALADSLKDNPNVPNDVAKSLASDVGEVAMPFVKSSMALSDSDLMEIIATRGADIQTAVASRENVSSGVADALADTGNEDVVATLVANEGADISDKTMGKVLDEFGDSEKVSGSMAQRKQLPIGIAERLVNLVSENLREHLVTHHSLSSDVAMDLVLASRERATIGLLDQGAKAPDVMQLVQQLVKNNRLTPTIIVRAICMGDLNFFETALAVKAGIPVSNAYQLINDEGGTGLKKLLMKCEIDNKIHPIVKAALDVVEETGDSAGDDREMFRNLMIERVLTACETEFEGENIDYLIGKLQG
jgi:uncharacterized protein (DUF2336 family)